MKHLTYIVPVPQGLRLTEEGQLEISQACEVLFNSKNWEYEGWDSRGGGMSQVSPMLRATQWTCNHISMSFLPGPPCLELELPTLKGPDSLAGVKPTFLERWGEAFVQ